MRPEQYFLVHLSDRVYSYYAGVVMIVIVILWVIISALVGAFASKKGLSGGGFFFLSLLISPLLGFIIASIKEVSRSENAITLEVAEDSMLYGDIYKDDRESHGDWIIKKEPKGTFITISTIRAFNFILEQLNNEKGKVLRDRIIEARQGISLA